METSEFAEIFVENTIELSKDGRKRLKRSLFSAVVARVATSTVVGTTGRNVHSGVKSVEVREVRVVVVDIACSNVNEHNVSSNGDVVDVVVAKVE